MDKNPIGSKVYGVDEELSELRFAVVIKTTVKQLVLDCYIHYIDLNGKSHYSKIVPKKFIPAKGLPTSPMDAIQQIYQTLIYDTVEARARYSEMLRSIDERHAKIDQLVKNLMLDPVKARLPQIRSRPATPQ